MSGGGGRRCRVCGRRLRPGARPQAVYCSAACRARQWRTERSLRKRAAAVRDRGCQRTCPQCGTTWVAGVDRRLSAVFCSPRCRTRAWRQRREGFAQPSL
ncbi:hypothetical protein FMM49_01210 (plasmid) [Streptomyces rimosus subsp. rimosus]|nr:hypothetical protein CTZ40_42240 [Streptomyces rimosus]QTL84594.1 hypothetical protein FMM49_01210 [Streptomyces rimosus subsp. rimosus]